jgi:hypothetical protein
MNAKLKKNKEKLEVVEAEERERRQRLEAERQASPSVAEFFGRLFRLRQGASMRIGLTDRTLHHHHHATSHSVQSPP